MTETESGPVVLLYGADNRNGHAISRRSKNSFNCLLRPLDFFEGQDLATAIQADIRAKQPTIVINALSDPSGGGEVTQPMLRYVAPTNAMIQQCRQQGVRYIQLSSSRVFGQREFMLDRVAYTEYDPALDAGDDPWRRVLLAMERCLLQQTSVGNAAALMSTHPGFQFYLLRAGELIYGKRQTTTPTRYCTLDLVPSFIEKGHSKFYHPEPQRLFSPLWVDDLAAAVTSLCQRTVRLRSGTYHIGPESPTSLETWFSHLTMRTGAVAYVQSSYANDPKAIPLAGLDADQAISSEYWRSHTKLTARPWHETLSLSLADK